MRSITPSTLALGLVLVVATPHGRADASVATQSERRTGATVDVLAEAISLTKEKALNAPLVDWPKVEAEARALAQRTPGEKGRTAAIRRVVAALQDNHSFYMPPMPQRRQGDSNEATEAARADFLKNAKYPARLPIATSDIRKPFARLAINNWQGPAEDVPGAMNLVRNELNNVLAANACGIIVDLSSNSGGNMWPMMAGIAPLYGEGKLLSFVDRAGMHKVVSVQRGALHFDNRMNPPADGMPPLRGPVPTFVAVIIGSKTSSSGEITALGFKGKENVRFFGEPTDGKTTSNWSKRLENGGMLALTASRIAVRSAEVIDGPVVPDTASDTPIEEADAWLERSCGPRNR